MKKLIFILLLMPFVVKAQVYQKLPQYGYIIDRIDNKLVLKIPEDTTNNKVGIARKNSSLYVGNGAYWTLSSGGGSSASDTFKLQYPLQLFDSAGQTRIRIAYSWQDSALANSGGGVDSNLLKSKFSADTATTNRLIALSFLNSTKKDKNDTLNNTGYARNWQLSSLPLFNNKRLEIGDADTIVGLLLNENFNGTSIPTGWVNNSASVSYNNKLIVASGSGSISNFGENLENGYFNFDKEVFSTTLIPKNKTSTSFGIGYTFSTNSLNYSISTTVSLNLTSNTDSGRINLNGLSSQGLSFSVGDTIIFNLEVNGWALTASAWNKRNNQKVSITQLNQNRIGTGGKFRLCFLGGQQDITNVNIYSYNSKGGVAFAGDSHTSGTACTIEANDYVSLLMNGNKNRYGNFGNPSITIGNYSFSGSWLQSVWANVKKQQPKQAVIALGYNDATITDTANFRILYKSVIDSFVSIGVKPILTTLVPRLNNTDVNTPNFNIVINNLGSIYGLKVANVFAALSSNNLIRTNYLSIDNIHLTDSGHLVMSETIRLIAPELFYQYVGDSISNVEFNKLPSGNINDDILVVKSNNYVYKIPNTIPKQGSYIENSLNKNHSAFQTSSISLKGSIKNIEGSIESSNSQGLQQGFNGGNFYGNGTAGQNINITNAGTSGLGYPQVFDNITGEGNIKIITSSSNRLKTNLAGAISGNNNVFINSHTATTTTGSNNIGINNYFSEITSGLSNIGIGESSLRGITTGSNNVHLVSKNQSASSFSTSLTGSVIIGDMLNNTGGGLSANNYEVWLAGGNSAFDQTFRFGGLGGADNIYFDRSPTYQVANRSGTPWYFRSSRGYGNGIGGSILFQTWNAGVSGTTINSTANTELSITNNLTTVFNGLKIDIASKGAGKFLQSDANGNATWQTVSSGGGTTKYSTNGYGTLVDSTTNLYTIRADTNTTAKLRDAAIDSKLNSATAATTYYPLTGGSYLSATNGTGFLGLTAQTTPPTAPTSGLVKLYANATGRLSWLTSLGFARTINSRPLTADRTYTFYDRDYTVADSADVAGKQNNLTLTTTGTSGSATLIGSTLNIPSYTSNSGTVTSVAALTLGTTGTDLSSSVATSTTTPVITLNVPTASSTNRGALSSTDWSTFNNKAPTASPTFTGVVTMPTPFTLGGTSVTTNATRFNYLNAATGTTGTTSSNVVFSASPTVTGLLTLTGTAQSGSGAIGVLDGAQTWNTTGAPFGINLNVTNTASGANARLLRLATSGTSVFDVSVGGNLALSGNVTTSAAGGAATFPLFQSNIPLLTAYTSAFAATGTISAAITGSKRIFYDNTTFSPTSGTARYSSFEDNRTINQTGTTTGIIAGIYINPTLTAAVDYRALDVVNGSIVLPYRAVTTTTTILQNNYTVDCTSGTFTLTLPTAVGVGGKIFVVKNSGTGVITLATTSSQLIDGTTTKTLNTQYSGYQLMSDNANWKIISIF
jgi:lysophospholipase L1-like esterase